MQKTIDNGHWNHLLMSSMNGAYAAIATLHDFREFFGDRLTCRGNWPAYWPNLTDTADFLNILSRYKRHVYVDWWNFNSDFNKIVVR